MSRSPAAEGTTHIMGYRKFAERTTLTDARESAEYTVEALDAYPDKAVHSLSKSIDPLLTSLDTLEAARRKARRQVIRANAGVRTWDGVSDDLVRDLVKDVLGAVRQDRAAPLFTAIFSSTPSEIVALTLAPEVEEFARILEVLAAKSTPAELRKAWTPKLSHALESSRAALLLRKTAIAAMAEAEADVVRAIERLDRARRGADGALTSYAAGKALPADFNDRFFPSTSGGSAKRTAAPAPDKPVPA
jgi:hypothetical protein